MPGEAPPQMIEIEAVGAIASLLEKRSSTPKSAASGQAPRSLASDFEASSHWPRMCLNIFLFHTLAITASSGMLFCLQEGVEAHDAEADRALAHGGVGGAGEVGAGACR